jgi:hypothetical protein
MPLSIAFGSSIVQAAMNHIATLAAVDTAHFIKNGRYQRLSKRV